MTAIETLHVGAERAPFVMLPRWLLHHREISDGAKVLYGMLHDLVAGREGPTRPVTRGQLAACCGVSVATVDRRLSELVAAGAVDKHAQFETHQGQLANVYWVRLSPPAANLQPPVDISGDPGCSAVAPPAANLQPPPLQPCVEGGCMDEAPSQEELKEELPPQPPRRAGGPEFPSTIRPGRRGASTNLRSVGANPRSEADRLEVARRAEQAARREAELEAVTARRRAAEAAARAETDAAETEALALSGVLDDERLTAVVARVKDGLARPLARSSLALSRAVVGWCRGAAEQRPGAFLAAVDGALTDDGHRPPDEDEELPARLALPTPAPGTPALRERIAAILTSATAEAAS